MAKIESEHSTWQNIEDQDGRIHETEKQIKRMEAQWTDKQVQADQVFVKVTQAEVKLNHMLEKNEAALQTLPTIVNDYVMIKESIAQLRKGWQDQSQSTGNRKALSQTKT